jgi:hypothetical protein
MSALTQAPLPLAVAIEPARNTNTLVYAPVAPTAAGEKPTVMIGVMFRLTNQGAMPLHFRQARFTFAGPPFVADVLYTQDDVLGDLPGAVTINPGQTRNIHFSRLVTIRFTAPAPLGVTVQIFCEESSLPITVFRSLAAHVNPVAGGAYRLPFKAGDLPTQGVNAGRSGHKGSGQRYAYDSGAVQWDAQAEQWRGLKPGETENTNENAVDWELPVYAMADGEVISFAHDVADNPHPPEKVMGGGGNHFWIRHGSDRVLYAHFRRGSLNAELLRAGAAVQRGQFLGRIGNSGSSTGAHLHIHAVRLADNVFQPILFSGGYVVERALLKDGELSASWAKLEGHVLPFTTNAIWPARFLPVVVTKLGDSGSQHTARAFELAALHPSALVTAMRENSGRLRVVSWSVSADGEQIAALGDSLDQAGEVGRIRLLPLSSGLFCTVVATAAAKRLRLLVWQLGDGGKQVTRLGDSDEQAGSVGELDAVALGAGQIATVVRTQEQRHKVILWQVSHDGQTVQRLGDSGSAGLEADLVSIASAGLGRFVTAVRRDDGRLLIEVWESSPDGNAIVRKSDSGDAAGRVGAIRVVAMGLSQVVTAVRTTNETLKLISWSLAEDGTLTRSGDSGDQAGGVQMIAATQPEPEILVTTVVTAAGQLKLIVWHVAPEGEITRLGDSGQLAGAANHAGCTALSSSRLVSGLRSEAGRLRLMCWSLASVQSGPAKLSPFNFDLADPAPRAFEDAQEADDIADDLPGIVALIQKEPHHD